MASEHMPRRENNREKEKERESGDDGGGVHHVRKFETKGDEKKKGLTEKTELERRTREVKGREWNEEEKQRRPRGKVEAEKARPMEKSREEAKGRENSETKEGRGVEQGGEEQGSGREETGEENKQSSLEEISRYRAEAQQKAINAIEGAKERYDKEKEKESATEASREKATEEATQAKDKGGNDAKHGKGRKETGEENEQLSLEEISKYRAEAQQKAMNAIEGAKERYEREKLAASEASEERDLKENEEATQAKDKKAETRELDTKEYAERDLEAKREAQNQEQGGKWEPGPIGQTIDQVPERTAKADESNIFGGVQERNQREGVGDTSTGEREQKPLGDDIIGESFQGKGDVMTSIGEKLGSAAQTIKKPLDKATEGGREVLGAVGETVVEIGEMVIPTQKVHIEVKELNAIGETIAEIAETTRVIVAGEGEKDLITSDDYDSGKHGDLKLD
ncbi:hypothetical protein Fmac_021558 [Flemingia macrophylla]|uniref:Uncharacterized protein n=1 Tax=Flemingia macrophylla TaxID=520843 RepID=A0ABD1LXC1_9FABA